MTVSRNAWKSILTIFERSNAIQMCSLVSILYTFYITFFRIYYVKNPLSKNQEKLRGRKVSDMAIEELKSWIEACNRMEKWVSYNKARRSWTQSRMEAETELEKRINET